MTPTTLYAVRDASVVRGRRRLVDALSLDVRTGELLVVMGENGAGKSTLVHLLAGDLVADEGVVTCEDRPLAEIGIDALARRRAVLPQQHALDLAFTAREVVLLGRLPHHRGRAGADDRAVARRALERVDAAHLSGRLYPTLSGGERARVMLARVVAQIAPGPDERSPAPRALFVDEPSAALDLAHQHGAFGLLRSLARDDGVAVVAVVHDPNLAARYADRVLLLRAGRAIACGAAADVLTPSLLEACFGIRMVRLDGAGASALVAVP